MKKILTLSLALLATGVLAWAQTDAQKEAVKAAAEAIAAAPDAEKNVEKPKYWTESLELNLGFNHTQLSNWAAGGYNTLVMSSSIDAKANYQKDLTAWTNRLQLDYGFLHSSDKNGILQKNNDRMYLESKFGYKTSKDSKWNYSASFDFRSQFSKTPAKYVSDDGGTTWRPDGLKSGYLSPAYTNIALGMEWIPTEWFNVNIAPLTGSLTICDIESLRKNYGMPLKNDEVTYANMLFQFGAQIKTNFKMTINEVFNYDTQLVLFSNYLDHPQNLRVNWDNKITWAVMKYFKVAFNTWLIYDPLVRIDGKRRIQFKDFFSINFSYTFQPRK